MFNLQKVKIFNLLLGQEKQSVDKHDMGMMEVMRLYCWTQHTWYEIYLKWNLPLHVLYKEEMIT